MKIKTTFDSAGEEFGTLFDYSDSCQLCGANRKQIGYLKLSESHIPKKDISRTISGEIVVSEKFVKGLIKEKIKGINVAPIFINNKKLNYYQITTINKLDLSKKTLTGVDPWDFSEESDEIYSSIQEGYNFKIASEIYKCPKGHLLGLNILSEAFLIKNQLIEGNDFFESTQKIGVKRGYLQPNSLYFCSPLFRNFIFENKFTGFEFEPAYFE